MSFAGGFRRLQVLSDLSRVTASASEETLTRIAGGIPGVTLDALAQVVLSQGPREDTDPSVADTIQFGAAKPDEDFDGFIRCTATLIRDRLWGGDLGADLFWIWESFHDQIALAEPDTRAAIVQGLNHAAASGFVTFDPPPLDPLLASDTPDQIMDALEDVLSQTALPRKSSMMSRDHDPLASPKSPDFVPSAAAVVYGAMQAPERVDLANALWRRHGSSLADSESEWAGVLCRGLRHLFETNPGFDPWPDAQTSGDVTFLPVRQSERRVPNAVD